MKIEFKKIIFYIIALILFLGLLELICFVVFATFKKRFTFFDFNKYLAGEKYLEYAHQKYNPERGWDNLYPTEAGERPRRNLYNKPFISTFGDSYTHCDGVKDDETWEERLSLLLKKDVYNFGTGDYGTDQAYLKFLTIFPKVRTTIVILGLIPENINRIVNVYRPFYFENTGIKLSKPRFILKQNELILLHNPVPSLEKINELNDVSFLKSMGKNDFWFNRDGYPISGFLYSKILLNRRIWLESIRRIKGQTIDDIQPRPYVDLWEDAETTALMFKILDSFSTKAKEYNSVPIIMILPTRAESETIFTKRKNSLVEKKILEFCQSQHILLFNANEALAKNASSINELEAFFNEHISVKGNELIAYSLYIFLKEFSLVD